MTSHTIFVLFSSINSFSMYYHALINMAIADKLNDYSMLYHIDIERYYLLNYQLSKFFRWREQIHTQIHTPSCTYTPTRTIELI